jgi:hypothetical protein
MRLNLADDSGESKAAYRNLRGSLKLVCGEYIDFQKALAHQDPKTMSRAVHHAVSSMPEYVSCHDVNCRLSGNVMLARDFIMLICQDESRNKSRKVNAAKKQRGIEVKIGRRKTITKQEKTIQSKGIQRLAFLTSRSYC